MYIQRYEGLLNLNQNLIHLQCTRKIVKYSLAPHVGPFTMLVVNVYGIRITSVGVF